MGYQPIFDASFDVVDTEVNEDGFKAWDEILKVIFSNKLVLVGYNSAQGGQQHPELTLRGTKAQLMTWLRWYLAPTDGQQTDDELWAEAYNDFHFKQVA